MDGNDILSIKTLKQVIQFALNIWDTPSKELKNPSEEEVLAHHFFMKNIMASFTILNTLDPIPRRDMGDNHAFNDFMSGYVVLRSLFEGYTNMYYLLVDPNTKKEKEFRKLLWDKHAHQEWKNLTESSGSRLNEIPKCEKNIESVINKIKAHEYFGQLNTDDKSKALNPETWKLHGRNYLRDCTGIDNSLSDYLYKLMSNYTHAEAYSLRIIGLAESIKDVEEEFKLIMFTEMFTVLTIMIYSQTVSVVEKAINDDSSILVRIKLWEEYSRRSFKEENYKRFRKDL